jgi:hypothetical protein
MESLEIGSGNGPRTKIYLAEADIRLGGEELVNENERAYELASLALEQSQAMPFPLRLSGPVGSGRRALVLALARKLGLNQVYSMVGHSEMTPEDFMLSIVPVPSLGRRDPRLRFCASPMATALLTGGLFYLEGIDRVLPRALSPLSSLLDERLSLYSTLAQVWLSGQDGKPFYFCCSADHHDKRLPEFLEQRLAVTIRLPAGILRWRHDTRPSTKEDIGTRAFEIAEAESHRHDPMEAYRQLAAYAKHLTAARLEVGRRLLQILLKDLGEHTPGDKVDKSKYPASAIQSLRILTAQSPYRSDPDKLNNIGHCLMWLDDLNPALLAVEAALMLDPEHDFALVTKGEILSRQGKFEEARTVLAKARPRIHCDNNLYLVNIIDHVLKHIDTQQTSEKQHHPNEHS